MNLEKNQLLVQACRKFDVIGTINALEAGADPLTTDKVEWCLSETICFRHWLSPNAPTDLDFKAVAKSFIDHGLNLFSPDLHSKYLYFYISDTMEHSKGDVLDAVSRIKTLIELGLPIDLRVNEINGSNLLQSAIVNDALPIAYIFAINGWNPLAINHNNDSFENNVRESQRWLWSKVFQEWREQFPSELSWENVLTDLLIVGWKFDHPDLKMARNPQSSNGGFLANISEKHSGGINSDGIKKAECPSIMRELLNERSDELKTSIIKSAWLFLNFCGFTQLELGPKIQILNTTNLPEPVLTIEEVMNSLTEALKKGAVLEFNQNGDRKELKWEVDDIFELQTLICVEHFTYEPSGPPLKVGLNSMIDTLMQDAVIRGSELRVNIGSPLGGLGYLRSTVGLDWPKFLRK